MTHNVSIGGGRVRVPLATYALYLAGVEAAALIEREGQVLLLPLRGPAAGGLLLKQRNLLGDRVMQATEFLARIGMDPFSAETEFEVKWIADAAALQIVGLHMTSD